MSVYTVVGEAPKDLTDKDLVINKPMFLEEIAKTRVRRGVVKLTTASNLRDIFMAITNTYDPTINPYHLKLSKYEGIKYDSDQDLAEVVQRIIRDNNLNLIEAAIDKALKTRAPSVETIYFVTSDLDGIAAFAKNGVSALKLDKKGKKTENSENLV
jgi:hypothetical protein